MSAIPQPSATGQQDTAQPAPQAAPQRNRERAIFARGLIAGALVMACLLGAATLWYATPRPPPMVVHPPPAQMMAATAAQTMTVYVTGAVARPGVYVLHHGARVGDALAAAGGLATNAAARGVNLAWGLNDGAHVLVPALGEETPLPGAGAAMTGSRSGVIVDLGARLNINTATLEELVGLPGIGAARAQQIIDGRPYATVDDLDRISGIGPATLDKLRQLVTAP